MICPIGWQVHISECHGLTSFPNNLNLVICDGGRRCISNLKTLVQAMIYKPKIGVCKHSTCKTVLTGNPTQFRYLAIVIYTLDTNMVDQKLIVFLKSMYR